LVTRLTSLIHFYHMTLMEKLELVIKDFSLF